MPKTIEELEAELKAEQEKSKTLETSKARLVDESKSYKERAQTAETDLATKEEERLKANGETQILLDNANAKNLELTKKLDTTTSNVLREKLRSEISKHAKDAHDIDMLLKITEHKDVLKIDEETLTIEGGKEFVDKARETHKFLFSKKSLEETEVKKPNGEDVNNKTDDEKYLAELATCNTRQEINACRKKYGKVV